MGNQSMGNLTRFFSSLAIAKKSPMARPDPRDAHSFAALETGRIIAARILEDPSLVVLGMEHLDDLDRRRGGLPLCDLEWRHIIRTHTPQEIAELLCLETEDAQRLRSSEPFHGDEFISQNRAHEIYVGFAKIAFA